MLVRHAASASPWPRATKSLISSAPDWDLGLDGRDALTERVEAGTLARRSDGGKGREATLSADWPRRVGRVSLRHGDGGLHRTGYRCLWRRFGGRTVAVARSRGTRAGTHAPSSAEAGAGNS